MEVNVPLKRLETILIYMLVGLCSIVAVYCYTALMIKICKWALEVGRFAAGLF